MRTLSFCTLLLAIALMPVAAQDNVSAVGFSVPRVGLPVHPAAGAYAGIAATSVTVGLPVSGLPCFSCISGVVGNDAGISMPLAVISQGTQVTITVLFEDTAYSGPCNVTYHMKQNGAAIQNGNYVFPSGCTANTFEGVYFNVTVPSSPGPMALQAVVTAGTIKTGVVQNLTIQ